MRLDLDATYIRCIKIVCTGGYFERVSTHCVSSDQMWSVLKAMKGQKFSGGYRGPAGGATLRHNIDILGSVIGVYKQQVKAMQDFTAELVTFFRGTTVATFAGTYDINNGKGRGNSLTELLSMLPPPWRPWQVAAGRPQRTRMMRNLY